MINAKNIQKLFAFVLLLVVAYLGVAQNAQKPARHDGGAIAAATDSDQTLAAAFRNRLRDVPVQGVGQVARILPDDDDGTRHQKFIVELASGQKLLIAHNIELAERVDGLRVGDTVEFRGEYEWNPQGGVVHWTHRDPAGRHAPGWLKHNGQTFH